MTLAINDLVSFAIIENGYWKGEAIGRIDRETEKFWVIRGSSTFFWNSDKAEFVTRRISKATGGVRKKEPRNPK